MEASTMASPRSVQKELESLRKEIAGLRQDYARLKRRANATTAEAADRFASIRDGVADTIEAIREKVTDGTGTAAEEISAHLSDLRDAVHEYSDRTERTVAAHPFATLAGAIALGYLIARIGRQSQ
jgi:ElaB/YqjD/DUF883 family membrane-anchored ribosome-binding protein